MPNELLNDFEYQEDDDLATRLHVVFNLGAEAWALPMVSVREIVRVPSLTRVPRSPSALLGLANLRGSVIPVYSLRRLAGLADVAAQDNNRAIVLEGHEPMAVVVDRISRVSLIEQLEPLKGGQNTDPLIIGASRQCAGYPLVMVLNHQRLQQLCRSEPAACFESRLSHPENSNSDSNSDDDSRNIDLCQFVCCRVANQEYAIPIEQIRRIMEPVAAVSSLPDSPPGVLGAISLGDETLTLIHLAGLFHLDHHANHERARILVTDHPGQGLGLLVEQVIGVLRLHREQIRAVGSLLSGERDMEIFSGLCQLQQGKRLIAIIDLERLLKLHGLPCNSAREAALEPSDGNHDADEENNDLVHMVVYRLGTEEFASPVSCIHEIVRMPDHLQPVPAARLQVDGLMNLRGNILPVADLRARLGMPRGERHERQRILVFSDHNERSGFVVDQVVEILKITPSPALDEHLTATPGHDHHVINLTSDGRLIQVITPARLLSRHPDHGVSL